MFDPAAKTLADRLDPGGELGTRALGLTALATRLGPLLRCLGVDAETLSSARNATVQYRSLIGRLDSTAALLAPHGWLLFELAPQEDYMAAAESAAAGDIDAAEELIIRAWNDSDSLRLRFSVQRVLGLYRLLGAELYDDTVPDIGHGRATLIAEAIESHRDGRYASAINIALAQIDGIVTDFSPEGQPFL